jgi:hypothetical protein
MMMVWWWWRGWVGKGVVVVGMVVVAVKMGVCRGLCYDLRVDWLVGLDRHRVCVGGKGPERHRVRGRCVVRNTQWALGGVLQHRVVGVSADGV